MAEGEIEQVSTQVTSTDLARQPDTAPVVETDEDKLRKLIEGVRPAVLDEAELDKFPNGRQFHILGPRVHITSGDMYRNVPRGNYASQIWGTDGELDLAPQLGIFNVIPGETPDSVILDYHPSQPEGQPFEIVAGNGYRVTSEVSAGDLYQGLSGLFLNGQGFNRDESVVHFGNNKINLKFRNRDGTPKTDSASLPAVNTRPGLPPGTAGEK